MYPTTLLRELLADARTALEPLLVYHDVGPYGSILEDELRRRSIYWRRRQGTLDATFCWYDVRRRVAGPGAMPEEEKSALRDLVRAHWVDLGDGTGAYTDVILGEPSVYASRIALLLLKLSQEKGTYDQLGYDEACDMLGGRDVVEKTIRFVLQCQTDGGFKTSHRLSLPAGVRTSHSAYFLLRDLQRADDSIAEGVGGFLSRCFVDAGDGAGGFAEVPPPAKARPVACATYYALSIIRTARGPEATAEYAQPVSRFLRSSWHPRLGGFRATAPRFRRFLAPSLPHTVFAVQGIRRMLGFDSLEAVGVSTPKVLQYIDRCWTPHGYRFRPTALPLLGSFLSPNILVTRYALLGLSALQPEPSEQLEQQRRQLRENLGRYRVGGGARGYPPPLRGKVFRAFRSIADWLLRPADPMADMRFTPVHLYAVAVASLGTFLTLLIWGSFDRRLWPFDSDVAWPIFCASSVLAAVSLGEIGLWFMQYKRRPSHATQQRGSSPGTESRRRRASP